MKKHASIFVLFFFVLINQSFSQGYFELNKLPDFINSPYSEITPVPSRDGRTLYFTRVGHPDFDKTLFIDSVDRALKLSPENYTKLLSDVYSQIAGYKVYNPERSSFNQEIWIATGDSIGFDSVYHPGYPLNNALPNSMVTITPDPNAFYVINQFLPNGDMARGFSRVSRSNDSIVWAFPQPIDIEDYYTITSDVSLTMSFDGQILILSAARFDSRDMDLYVCFRKGKDEWTAPKHMGGILNSEWRETTPFLSEDNTTLYFSSNRPGGLGGNDIYTSNRLDSTWINWSKPEKVREPINSKFDDSQPYFNMTSGYIYFTSKRDGNSDVFRVRIAPPQATEMEVRGRVVNRKTNEIISGALVYYNMEKGERNTLVARDGTFRLKIPKGVKTDLVADVPGFAGEVLPVIFRRDYYYFREQNVVLYLDPLSVNSKIELRPIYFQQSTATILKQSYDELERLFLTLAKNPGMYIRIEGHTDNIGKREDLMTLSLDRAQSIKQYLIEKGIAEHRIETVGFGPDKPLTDNSSDEMRSLNRRVEVIITRL
ncbi:MAG: OmpA family protein [Lewinellaceae bacterium]|nr:OmpA family protein [Saprospiraceae bacterium]MCB9342928.1 OmpA family protein [Lewinellaceae bacterium]